MGQRQGKGEQKNPKDLHDVRLVRLRERMVRERRNRKKYSWPHVLGESCLPQCWLLFFLVSLLLRSLAICTGLDVRWNHLQCEISTQGLIPGNSAAASVVKSTW